MKHLSADQHHDFRDGFQPTRFHNRNRARSKKQGRFFVFVLLVFIGFSCFMIGQGVRIAGLEILLHLKGVKVSAQITDIAVTQLANYGDGTSVSQTEYLEISFPLENGEKAHTRLYCQQQEFSYEIGDMIVIRYNPNNLKQVINTQEQRSLVQGSVAILVGAVFFVISAILLYREIFYRYCANEKKEQGELSVGEYKITFSKQDIWDIAMSQSALDSNCQPTDFLRLEPIVVCSKDGVGRRKYLSGPYDCDLTSYGNNVVASVREDLTQLQQEVEQFLHKYSPEHCFETPNLHVLDHILNRYGLQSCFMAEYFLPDPERLQLQNCPYTIRRLEQSDFQTLYQPQWSNALCKQRKHLDKLGMGAYDGEKLIGLAACSEDCDSMWQIGVDVLPDYRHQGVASALTSRLALEILACGKIPFYCAAWSNIRSVRNAIRCGFVPAWVQLTAKEKGLVQQMNDQ